jgi:hypothetical protein
VVCWALSLPGQRVCLLPVFFFFETLSAFTFLIILLPLLSNITVFLFSVQSPTFQKFTRRISPCARWYTSHFSRLLRHAWVTVGLFFFPGHHTGDTGLLCIILFYTPVIGFGEEPPNHGSFVLKVFTTRKYDNC